VLRLELGWDARTIMDVENGYELPVPYMQSIYTVTLMRQTHRTKTRSCYFVFTFRQRLNILHETQITFQLTEITLTNVVLPDICKPTKVISISSFQKRPINQFKIR